MTEQKLSDLAEPEYKVWLKNYFKQSWWKILVLTMFAALGIAIDLLSPFPMKILADSVFGSVQAPGPLAPYTGTFTLLAFVAAFYVILYVTQTVVGFLSSYVGARFNFSLDIDVKQRFFRHLLYLPGKSSQRLNSADYVYRLNQETSTVPGYVLGTSVTILQSCLTIVGVLVILLLINWSMTLISLLVVPLLFFSVRYFGKRIEAKSLLVEEAETAVYTHTTESIENNEIIQAFNRQPGQVNKLIELLRNKLHLELGYAILSGIFGFINSSITLIAILFIVLIGGRNVFSGAITFGDLLIFITYVGYLYEPLETLSGAIASRADATAALKRVFEVVNSYADIENVEAGKQLPRLKGQVVFKNITYSDQGRTILDNISFSIEPGQKVALVGPSGSGKSTILRMIPRFLIPDSGFIYLDGNELRGVNLRSLREQIALVSQEPKLFSITIGENIAFAKPDDKYPLPDVIASAEAAYASEFIETQPNKFNTSIKQAGDSLSGGQKQRIAIARAFFKKAPILILDEPTSAQDVSSEVHVLDGVNRLMQGRTVIMATHKHSLLAQMDKVYVVEGGKVTDINQLGGLDAYERYLEIHER